MNDDRLAQELQRRADSAASRPDWVRRDLLPAVRHEIDARPQRVMTSNWSPRLGVAAVVATLLILVIAVPRLTPQPPAATPSPSASPAPGPDTVLSTADFAAGVASGALDDRVVLVAGKVSVPAAPPPFSFPCDPPDGVCGLGVLDGTDPPVYVDSSYEPTTDTPGSGTWAGGDGGRDYHFPSVPIEGVLALRVMSHNHAFFIGVAGQDGAAPVRSVAEAQAIDISTVGLDQVVLVDGWLGGSTTTLCLAYPFPTIPLLSSRACTNELVSRDPDPKPGSPVIQVQPGAYAHFAPNPSVQEGNEPREGLYALTPSLEGWCDAAQPPCWLWNVVARLNGPPDVPTSANPTTIECATSGGLPITLTDQTGVVAGCRSVNLSSGDQGAYLEVLNPHGDLATLAVWLTLNRCISRVDAQFGVATSGYSLVITEGKAVPGCAGPPVSVGFELDLRTDIAASTVTATRAAAPSSPPQGARQIPCDLALPVVMDETGLVTGCKGSTTMPAEGAGLTVTNAPDDPTRLVVSWAEACSSNDILVFRPSDSGYELVVSWVERNSVCDGIPVQYRFELQLSVPITAETVTIRYQAHPPESTPSPTPTATPAPSGSPSMPAVLTTDEFSAALAQGHLDGMTVLVNGTVEPVDWKSGPICALPPATCMLGQLVGDAEPPIIVSAYRFQVREEDDHATYSGDGVTWASWAGPDAPVDGTLVFSVMKDYRKVIFLGVAREGGSGAISSVAAAAAINVESLDQEEVVLVDGWLTGIDYPLFCPAPAHPRLDGLPSNDWCSNGAWLMSDATQLDPSSFSIPPDSIRVQSGAFDEFAPEPGLRDGRDVVPQHGIYAIAKRLFGGGRGEEPPFWAWAVVGRIGN